MTLHDRKLTVAQEAKVSHLLDLGSTPKIRPLLLSVDFAQAELCSLAQVNIDKFGFSEMGNLINKGVDLHLFLVQTMKGIPYEELVARKKLGDKQVKEWRQAAKAANFGYPGGLGVEKFIAYAADSYGVELEHDEAKRLKDAWLATFPEMKQYFRWISGKLQVSDFFTVVQHRSGRRRGRCGYTDGANSYFQGLTADGAGYAVIVVSEEAWLCEWSPFYGWRLIGFFYDELFGALPDRGPKANHEAAYAICDRMSKAMRVFTPDVEARCEPALQRNWCKAAEPVFNSDGYLIPWEDREIKIK